MEEKEKELIEVGEVEIEQLSVDMVAKAHEKYEKLKEEVIIIDVDGEEKEVKLGFYEVFSPSGVKECVDEFVRNLDLARKTTARKSKTVFAEVTEPYFMYLLIKHFTNMGKDMPNRFNEQLVSLKHMIDVGVFFQIISHFEESEIEKMRDALLEATKTLEENQFVVDEIKKLAEGKIDNKELLE